MKTLLFALPLVFLLSCGKDSGSGSSNSVAPEAHQDELMTDGEYKAFLRPLNPTSHGFIPYGNAEFKLKGDVFTARTYLDDDAPVAHMQSIHLGSRCPTPSDDLNGDGLIDIQEAIQVVGPVIVPLDLDLSSQKAGLAIYPKGSSFTYEENTSFSGMMKDLNSPDETSDDFIAKLMPNQGFSILGKVVLIHGTQASSKIPATVATSMNLPSNQTIPVVCGVIQEIPGVTP